MYFSKLSLALALIFALSLCLNSISYSDLNTEANSYLLYLDDIYGMDIEPIDNNSSRDIVVTVLDFNPYSQQYEGTDGYYLDNGGSGYFNSYHYVFSYTTDNPQQIEFGHLRINQPKRDLAVGYNNHIQTYITQNNSLSWQQTIDYGSTSLSWGKVNTDQYDDLATGCGNYARIFNNNQNGYLSTTPQSINIGSSVIKVKLLDMYMVYDNNLHSLLVATGNIIKIYENNAGTFSFLTDLTVAPSVNNILDFELSLLDGDNYNDLAVLIYAGSGNEILKCFSNNEDGAFDTTPYSTINLWQDPTNLYYAQLLTIGEYNYDGLPDIAVVADQGAIILENEQTGFDPIPIWETDQYFAFTVDHNEILFSDLAGYGGLSLVVAGGYGSYSGSGGKVFVFVYDGDPRPCPPRNLWWDSNEDYHPVLHWELNIEDDINQYKVYRNMGEQQIPDPENWVHIATLDHPTCSYTDLDVWLYQHYFNAQLWYKVTATDDASNESLPSNIITFRALYHPNSGEAGEIAGITASNRIGLSASPNPFNNQTTLKLAIPESGNLEIKVYDIEGREKANIYCGYCPAGIKQFQFDASTIPSGIYFCRVASEKEAITEKLLLVK